MPPETASIRAQRLYKIIQRWLSLALLALPLTAFPRVSQATMALDTVTPGRMRETKPPYFCTPDWAKREAALPTARLFELYWMGVTAWTGPGSENFVTPVVPDSVWLLIPRGYSRHSDNLHWERGSGASFSATYPSFAPFSCNDADRDRVEVVFGLETEPKPKSIKGTLREEIASRWQPENHVDARAVSVPLGIEEGFVIDLTLENSGARLRTEWLSYLDDDGRVLVARCNPDAEVPGCEFNTMVPGTKVAITYKIVWDLLPHRREIDAGVRKLVQEWLNDAR